MIKKYLDKTLTKEIMEYFYKILCEIYNQDFINSDELNFIECTFGWEEALKKTCDKFDLIELEDLFNGLDYYDFNLFCSDFDEYLIKYNIVSQEVENKTVKKWENFRKD